MFALRRAESSTSVGETCQKMGISEATLYNWMKKYGDLGVSELRRLRQLEEKSRKLKRLAADLSLDKMMLQDVIQKTLRPVRRHTLIGFLQRAYGISQRRACGVMREARWGWRKN